jgi:hypothetical protein
LAQTAFDLTYHGPALADGRMPVRDLAPALLALGEVFAEASIVAYPDREPVALNFKATGEGSFVVELILHAGDTWDQVRDLLTSDTATALANLFGIVGGSYGIFALFKRLFGRRITGQEPLPGPGRVRLTLDDGSTLEVQTEALALYLDADIRKKVRKVVEPLERPGVERLDFRRDDEATVEIEEADLPAYEVEGEEEPLGESEAELVLEIASVAFRPGNRWRFTIGDDTFWAAIEDEGFLERVRLAVESFRNGDMLRCRIRIIQSRRDGHLHAERVITEVLEHIPAEPQLRLDEEDEEDEEDATEPPGEEAS